MEVSVAVRKDTPTIDRGLEQALNSWRFVCKQVFSLFVPLYSTESINGSNQMEMRFSLQPQCSMYSTTALGSNSHCTHQASLSNPPTLMLCSAMYPPSQTKLRRNAPFTHRPQSSSSTTAMVPSNRKPIPLHTTPVLIHQAFTILLRLVALRKEHAVVSGGLFVFADAAGLALVVSGGMER